jgi:hypothetical protein
MIINISFRIDMEIVGEMKVSDGLHYSYVTGPLLHLAKAQSSQRNTKAVIKLIRAFI